MKVISPPAVAMPEILLNFAMLRSSLEVEELAIRL